MVIVVALFVVALVATMAYSMMARLDRDTQRTSLLLRNVQAEFYAQGSIAWAIDQLRTDWDNQQANQLVDPTPIKAPIKEVNGYKITSTIYDMQGRFNLNNLNNEKTEVQSDFVRLLRTVQPNLSTENAENIGHAVVNWVSQVAEQGDDGKYSSESSLPYRVAHRPMISVSELRLVKGVTPQLFNALQPYVTTLPVTTQINIQSASAPVFLCLSPTITSEGGQEIEKLRTQTPFVSTQAFLALDVIKKNPLAATDKITVVSSYFLVETEVEIENQHVVLYTLLERNAAQGKKATVTLLWQSKGQW